MHSASDQIELAQVDRSTSQNDVLAGRLKAVRAYFRLSQTAMARKAGVAARTWQEYEAGKIAPGAVALTELHKNGVDLGWLLTGVGEMMRVEPSSAPGQVLIPRYDVRPAAGAAGGVSDPDEPTDFLTLDRDWIRRSLGCRPDALVLVEAGGDSMHPTIADRDPLLVDTSERDFRQNSVYVFRVGETVQVKRILRKVTGDLVLISDNPHYPPEPLSKNEAETLEVIGRVVWHGHKL